MKEDSTLQEIKKGLLIIAVLQVIGRKQVYASEILTALSASEFKTQEGTLYPLLSRLKRSGHIEHQWVESPNGPPRKYYRLSAAGRQHLRELMSYNQTLQKQLIKLGGKHE